VLKGLHLDALNAMISRVNSCHGDIVASVQIVGSASTKEFLVGSESIDTVSATIVNVRVYLTGLIHLSASNPGGDGGFERGPSRHSGFFWGAHGFPSTIHSFEVVSLCVGLSITFEASRCEGGRLQIVLDFEVIPVAQVLGHSELHVEVLEFLPVEARSAIGISLIPNISDTSVVRTESSLNILVVVERITLGFSEVVVLESFKRLARAGLGIPLEGTGHLTDLGAKGVA